MTQQASRSVFRKIVVGVDRSPSSVEAFAWAVAVARAGGGEVVPVHAWLPGLGGEDSGDRGLERHEAAFRGALSRVNTTGVVVTPLFVTDDRVTVMTEAAVDADLMVLGAPRHHGLGRLMTGSLAAELAARISVPLVVMPRPDVVPQPRPASSLLRGARHDHP